MPQTYTQKYTVVCFFNVQPVGLNFPASDWPLHVTILDTFKTEWHLDTLTSELAKSASGIAPIDVTPTEQTMLGPDRDVPVKLLRLDQSILSLHNKLLELSNKGEFIYNTPEFVGTGFLPHVTDPKASNVQIGQGYHLDSISLVDMFPGGDHMRREVIGTFTLKG